MKVYKIRNKASGLFSQGGTYRYRIWHQDGKSWNKRNLNAHIAMVRQMDSYGPYANDPLEIVEFELNEVSKADLIL